MRSKVFGLFLTLAFILTAGVVFAQDAPVEEKKEEVKEKPKASVSGVLYLEYFYDVDDNQKTDATKHGFNMTRAYLTAENKINDNFKVKLTLDAGQADDMTTVTTKTSTPTYTVFVKNAFVEGNQTISDSVKMNFQLGLIGTPIIGLVDGLSDYRWVYNNYVDKNGDLGVDLQDSSADMGLSVTFNLLKMVDLTGVYTNGEGFNKNGAGAYKPEAVNSGKSYYGVVSINPFVTKEGGKGKKNEGLYINGFAKYETLVLKNADVPATYDRTNMYYGGGIAWYSGLIKAGVNYIMFNDKPTATTKVKGSLIDAYVNADLNSVAGMPILLMGRYAMGKDDIKSEAAEKSEKTVMAGGAGYKFNDNFRVLAYYQHTKQDLADEQAAYIKTEAKF